MHFFNSGFHISTKQSSETMDIPCVETKISEINIVEMTLPMGAFLKIFKSYQYIVIKSQFNSDYYSFVLLLYLNTGWSVWKWNSSWMTKGSITGFLGEILSRQYDVVDSQWEARRGSVFHTNWHILCIWPNALPRLMRILIEHVSPFFPSLINCQKPGYPLH